MIEINILEAKENFSKLMMLLETKLEDEILICRNGIPYAKLSYYGNQNSKRVIGKFEGKYPEIDWDEFNKMDDEIIKSIS